MLDIDTHLRRIVTQFIQQVIDYKSFAIFHLKQITMWSTDGEDTIGNLIDVIIM